MYLGVVQSKLRPKWGRCHLCGRGTHSVVAQVLMESWASFGVRLQKGHGTVFGFPRSQCVHTCVTRTSGTCWEAAGIVLIPCFNPIPQYFQNLGMIMDLTVPLDVGGCSALHTHGQFQVGTIQICRRLAKWIEVVARVIPIGLLSSPLKAELGCQEGIWLVGIQPPWEPESLHL